jgi:mycothiol maleylpyruvate isomerase-like protein
VGVNASHVETARDIVIAFLERLQQRDWKAAAPDLEWNCERTLQHVINTEIYYAMLLATRASAPIPFPRGAAAASGLSPGDMLVEQWGSASVLSAVIRDAPREVRAFHSGRNADATGFAAVACDELLVHAWDIGRGLGETFKAPDDLTGDVIARLFPWAATGGEPWSTFLWCNGRIAIDERGRLEPDWPRWVAPLEEWDGTDPTVTSE